MPLSNNGFYKGAIFSALHMGQDWIELNRGELWGLIGGSMDLKSYSYDYRTKRFVFD